MPYRISLDRRGGPGYSIITNTGFDDQTIFRSHEDFNHFVRVLKRSLHRSPGVSLLAFCLEPQSFSLLLHEDEPGMIADFMHRTGVAYGVYFNGRYDKRGKVFHGPYKDTQLESDDAVVDALCTIHTSPKNEGEAIETYKWSSYRHYLRQSGSWIDTSFVTRYFGTREYLDDLQRITKAKAHQ